MLEERFTDRLTDRARLIYVRAEQEAKRLNHNYVGPEHILLGLIQKRQDVAVKVLELLGISLDDLGRLVVEIIGPGRPYPVDRFEFTPPAMRVAELSLREALQQGCNHVDTEHVLLGLIREGEGVAAKVLKSLGVDRDQVRQLVTQPQPQYPSPANRQHSEANADVPAKPRRPIRVTMQKRRNGRVRVDVTGGTFVAGTLDLRDSNGKIHHVQIKE